MHPRWRRAHLTAIALVGVVLLAVSLLLAMVPIGSPVPSQAMSVAAPAR